MSRSLVDVEGLVLKGLDLVNELYELSASLEDYGLEYGDPLILASVGLLRRELQRAEEGLGRIRRHLERVRGVN